MWCSALPQHLRATCRCGASKVVVEGNDIVTAGKPTAHNGSNANMPAGAQSTPSQAKVIVGR